MLDGATVPAQPSLPLPPLATQAVAPLVVQARLVVWPVNKMKGVALKEVMVTGGGAEVTVTTAAAGKLVPPGPEQVNVKV